MSDSNAEFARRIRVVLDAQKRTIRSLAEAVPVPYGTLQHQMNGRSPFPAWVIARISEELDVSADWLLTGMPYRLDEELLGKALETVALLFGAPSVFGGKRSRDAVAMFEHVYSRNYLDRVASPNPPTLTVETRPGGKVRLRRDGSAKL